MQGNKKKKQAKYNNRKIYKLIYAVIETKNRKKPPEKMQ